MDELPIALGDDGGDYQTTSYDTDLQSPDVGMGGFSDNINPEILALFSSQQQEAPQMSFAPTTQQSSGPVSYYPGVHAEMGSAGPMSTVGYGSELRPAYQVPKAEDSGGGLSWFKDLAKDPDKLMKYLSIGASILGAVGGAKQNADARKQNQTPGVATRENMQAMLEGVNDPAMAARIKAAFAAAAKARSTPGYGVAQRYTGQRSRFADGGLARFARGGTFKIDKDKEGKITNWGFNADPQNLAATPTTEKLLNARFTDLNAFAPVIDPNTGQRSAGGRGFSLLNQFKDPNMQKQVWADLTKDYAAMYRRNTGRDFLPTAKNLTDMGQAIDAIDWTAALPTWTAKDAKDNAQGRYNYTGIKYDADTDQYYRDVGAQKFGQLSDAAGNLRASGQGFYQYTDPATGLTKYTTNKALADKNSGSWQGYGSVNPKTGEFVAGKAIEGWMGDTGSRDVIGSNIFEGYFNKADGYGNANKGVTNALNTIYNREMLPNLTTDLQKYYANLTGIKDPTKAALPADVLAQISATKGYGTDYEAYKQQLQDYMLGSDASMINDYTGSLVDRVGRSLGIDPATDRNKILDYIGDTGYDTIAQGLSAYERQQTATGGNKTKPRFTIGTGANDGGSAGGVTPGTQPDVSNTPWGPSGVSNPLAGNDAMSAASAYGSMYGTAPTVGPKYIPQPQMVANPAYTTPTDPTAPVDPNAPPKEIANPQYQPARVNPYTGFDTWAANRGHTEGANNLPRGWATGGRVGQAPVGGLSAAIGGGHVRGATGGQADKIQALLSDGEYVMDAETVSALGDGNTEAGAKKLDKMRQNIRKHKRAAPVTSIPNKAKTPEQYLGKGK